MFKLPEDDRDFSWTRHAKNKLMYYGLSASRIKSVVRNPKRREEGIAPNTLAAMQSSPMKKKPEEIWVLYRTSEREEGYRGKKVLLISAWRYPGITKPGTPVPVPDAILDELGLR